MSRTPSASSAASSGSRSSSRPSSSSNSGWSTVAAASRARRATRSGAERSGTSAQRGQGELVDDGGGQQVPVLARQSRPPGGALDQPLDPDAGPSPAVPAGDARSAPGRRPGPARCACPRPAPAARRSWARIRPASRSMTVLAAARLGTSMPSAGWPDSGDSSRKLAARSDQPQPWRTPTPAASTAVPGPAARGGASRTVMAVTSPAMPSSARSPTHAIPRLCVVTCFSSRQCNAL